MALQHVVFKRDTDAFEADGAPGTGMGCKSGPVSIPYMARAANHLLGKKDAVNGLHPTNGVHSNGGANGHASGGGRSGGDAPNTMRRMTSWPAHSDARHKVMATGSAKQPDSLATVEVTPSLSKVAELEERVKNAPAGRADRATQARMQAMRRGSSFAPLPVAMRWLDEAEGAGGLTTSPEGAGGLATSPDATPASAPVEDERCERRQLVDIPDTPPGSALVASAPLDDSPDPMHFALQLGDVDVLDDADLLGDLGLSDDDTPTLTVTVMAEQGPTAPLGDDEPDPEDDNASELAI